MRLDLNLTGRFDLIGQFVQVARNGVEKLHFVLFNDLLVYGQAKKRRGVLRSVPLSTYPECVDSCIVVNVANNNSQYR